MTVVRAAPDPGALNALRGRAEAWLADDPDPASRDELRRVLDALPGSTAELTDRFAGPLRFGTAGLRGPLRAGPNGMNIAVVRAAAAGLVRWLESRGASGPLVIGYDARHGSAEFAAETAAVATGAGRRALILPGPLPTPVLAYAVRKLDAAAGVMVTASHNPPGDNGYKVYLGRGLGGSGGDGAQLAPPADAAIEAAIAAVGPLSTVRPGPPGWPVDDDLIASYVDGAASVAGLGGARDLTVAYTPLHGVGAAVFGRVMAAAGFAAPLCVSAQATADPDFPTVAFPNPEEPGAMDQVIALAAAEGADLAIAHDPDADRCAVATAGRRLSGDEVGILLADHLVRRGVAGRYVTTVVSSSLLRHLCAARGLPYSETLTGFKWIMRAGEDLVYGYEEALGYCVAPEHVRDKDGITAALLVCELAAGLKAEGRTLADRLDELAAEFGVHATGQLSLRVAEPDEIDVAMRTIRRHPPTGLLDEPVITLDDRLPEADVFILRTRSARVVVRPSGTEPKLKAYLEVVEPAGGGDLTAIRDRAAAELSALRTEVGTALGRA